MSYIILWSKSHPSNHCHTPTPTHTHTQIIDVCSVSTGLIKVSRLLYRLWVVTAVNCDDVHTQSVIHTFLRVTALNFPNRQHPN